MGDRRSTSRRPGLSNPWHALVLVAAAFPLAHGLVACGNDRSGGDDDAEAGGGSGASRPFGGTAGLGGSSGSGGRGNSGSGATPTGGVAGRASGGSAGAGNGAGSGGDGATSGDGSGGQAGAAGEGASGGEGGEGAAPPLPPGVTYIKASTPGYSDIFGAVISLSGNTLAVGARLEDSGATGINGNETDDSLEDAGAAYVFVRTTSGWQQQAYVKASNPGRRDGFGSSVAVSGNILAVSAPTEDGSATGVNGIPNDDANDAGAVYVFERTGSVWVQTAYVKASNANALDRFGSSIALDGDTLVVGAPNEGPSASGAGAVYVFRRSGSTWVQETLLRQAYPDVSDVFGDAVAIRGDTLAIGANGEDGSSTGVNGNQQSEGAAFAGAAWVFVRSGSVWTEQAYLKASNTEAADYFGRAVAVGTDLVVAGAPGEDSISSAINSDGLDNNRALAGAAYAFARSGTTWAREAYLKAPNPGQFGQSLGSALAISNDSLVASAPARGTFDTYDEGAVYRFVRAGSTWSLAETLTSPLPRSYAYFGDSVAIDGSVIAVGSRGDSSVASGINGNYADFSPTNNNTGAVWVFER